jgi:CBS domain-containing protein
MECPACGTANLSGLDLCSECGGDLRDLDIAPPRGGLATDLSSTALADLIPSEAVTISPETSVRRAIQELAETGRNCALVVAKDRIVGILTERDILRKYALEAKPGQDMAVSQIMTLDPVTLGPTDSIAFGLNRMTVGGYRHVPIATAEGHPMGVVSIRDVMRYVVKRYGKRLAGGN